LFLAKLFSGSFGMVTIGRAVKLGNVGLTRPASPDVFLYTTLSRQL